MDSPFSLYAIEIGRRTAQLQNFVYMDETLGPGSPIEIAYYFWCLKYQDHALLVDAGFEPQEAMARGLRAVSDPRARLSQIGVSPEQVKTIVLTHLHWDHAGGLALFPQADILAPRQDWELYSGPAVRHPMIRRYIRPEDLELLREAEAMGRVQWVHGEFEVDRNVGMHWVGGHTPGTHFVSIQTPQGRFILASDLGSLYLNVQEGLAPGIFQNLLESLEGLQRIVETAGDTGIVIPAHDQEVAHRFPMQDEGIIRLY